MGFFKRLFNPIDTKYSPETKEIYNKGVAALSKGNVKQAIDYFERVEYEHPSAAYNLGLIYLDGAGVLVPDYEKARQYFQQADEMRHGKARESAQTIGLHEEESFKTANQTKREQDQFARALIQFIQGGHCGNLAYILAQICIIWNENYTSRGIRDEIRFKTFVTEFMNYEIYCINKFANNEVSKFFAISSIKNFTYHWDNMFHMSEVSNYLNGVMVALVLNTAKKSFNKNMKIEELGVLRLMVINYVYEYCIREFGKDFFDEENNEDEEDDDLPF
ncbi:hypothetical protein QG025_03160 [Kingella kingae]|uniref:tetratricopeptide repeat protein n=1 Tax=Kingella kingae TaxID=504 RepID=UPI00255666FE|nr:hypothetical protein [Kingella kingae]MDK4580182.1 hypothetical protein [Kingella kingae]